MVGVLNIWSVLMKIYSLVFFVVFLSVLSVALPLKAEVNNWCGIYVQEKGGSFLMMPRDDIGIGSDSCSLSYYTEKKEEGGVVKIRLNSSRLRSIYAKWRKFLGHVIEVRGEYGNGRIEGVKFVRDFGIVR